MRERQFAFGVIEGFYGKPWSWEDRRQCAEFLQEHGYEFYIYAPKSDRYLREQWQEDWPQKEYDRLIEFSETCREKGIRFGIGLSPMEIYFDFSGKAKEDLKRKIRLIDDLKPDIFSLLFDDMKGDKAKLAELQIDVLNYAMDASTAESFIICPTYYTDDPILEQIFGNMPDNYLEDIGKLVDSSVDVFWTGDKVCSTQYTEEHLKKVTDLLGRKPFIWDNYPVNDAPWMSPFLHLRGFSGRSHRMSEWTAGHAVNPMNQAWLSQIPMRTLQKSYALKKDYDSEASFREASRTLCGEKLGECLIQDRDCFQDRGLENMSQEEKAAFAKKYRSYQSSYAQEVVDWLEGKYQP
ncbi:MAG: hyaluronidase [Proteobacteria bacterium]|nr:hyaluronidase [Pseudomonadota bacterium]